MSSRDLVVAAAAGASAPSDPYFEYNTLLLTGDGTNGAQNNTFLDSSTNNFTITRNGNTTQGSFSPYGNLWSNYFDGSGDSLSVASNAALNLSSGNFTIEGWFFPNNTSWNMLYDGRGPDDATNQNNPSIQWSSDVAGKITVRINAGSAITSGSITTNTWNHFALCRVGNVFTLYVNGVSQGTYTSSVTFTQTYQTIGGYGPGGYSFNGYISNLRVVKGTAVYTSNFTVPTTSLTAVSGTSLLTCQSNRFIDNSSNNFTLTVNGNTSVQRFSPFNPTTPYSAATIGGSGYFDGTGDYLVPSSTAPSNFGSGAFTVEFWVYFKDTAAYQMCVSNYQNASSGWGVYYLYDVFCGLLSGDGVDITGTTVIKANTWYHVAMSGTPGATGIKLFVNGVQEGSTYTGAVSLDSTSAAYIGQIGSGYGQFLNGYISDVRLIKGTAVYTSNFTPPTAPLTAITNTSLLLNFTNAGIPDAAMQNDLETVGNAQVSTSVKKYGTGSLYFDGTDDRLTMAASQNLVLGTGNFTIEGWVQFNDLSNRGLFQLSSTAGGLEASTTNNLAVGKGTAGGNSWDVYRANGQSATTATIATGTWYHFALVRNSSVTRLYINGTQVGADASDTTNYTGGNLCVGGYYSTSYLLNGYIDDLRITKGLARYTANFTPPAQALPTN